MTPEPEYPRLDEFLLDVIGSVERAARKAAEGTWGASAAWNPWTEMSRCESMRQIVALHRPIQVKHYTTVLRTKRPLRYAVKGVVFQPPARRMHRPPRPEPDGPFVTELHCAHCDCAEDTYPCKTLRLLAAPWSSNPRFNPKWAVDLTVAQHDR
jgi:hypothetical protein